MNIDLTYLSDEQRQNAIQRLTALWAFTESGLGGIMHALQIPFTGLLVGGMAVIMISLIADLAGNNFKLILKSAVIVLIIKAMISPHTPLPAYIAVSFQALLGFALFSLVKVNFFSIILLSSIAMLESAIQKILVLTLFLGKSLWKAMDEMMAMLAQQFGSSISNGSYWVIGIYLGIYIIGGFLIGWLAYRTIQDFKSKAPVIKLNTSSGLPDVSPALRKTAPKSFYKKLLALMVLMMVLSAVLFVFAADNKTGWLAVVKTITWTISAILIWYVVIGPLFIKAVQKLLRRNESRYRDEVSRVLEFIPVLKQLSVLAWQQSSSAPVSKRWHVFFSSFIHAALTYAEPQAPLQNNI